jgi:cell division protein ZapA (FtsZ GTPase activity inhibitor)
MKLTSQAKWSAFLIGGIGTVVAIAATTVRAQLPPSTSMPFPPQHGGSTPSLLQDRAFPQEREMNLTEEQEEEIAEINESLKNDIESILSDEQLDELQTAVDNGDDIQRVVNGLDLSTEQEEDLREAFQSAQQQISEALSAN